MYNKRHFYFMSICLKVAVIGNITAVRYREFSVFSQKWYSLSTLIYTEINQFTMIYIVNLGQSVFQRKSLVSKLLREAEKEKRMGEERRKKEEMTGWRRQRV